MILQSYTNSIKIKKGDKTQPEATNFMTKTYTIKDENGNTIEAKHENTLITLTLILNDEHKRFIGEIDKEAKILKIYRNRDKHLMRVNKSYGINYFLIDMGQLYNKIQLTDDFTSWIISKEYLIENCITMNFKKQGFELQKFITLEKLDLYKNNQEQKN